MAKDLSKLSDSEFIAGCLEDFYADQLSAQDTERYNQLLTDTEHKKEHEAIKESIGQFQLAGQAYYLVEQQLAGLHDIVEDAEIRRTREVQKIEQIGRWEELGDFRRRLSIVVLIVALAVSVIYYFTPAKKAPFDVLESLSYEALAMEEDTSGARLDLPTRSFGEISDFINVYSGLGYEPKLLRSPGGDWLIDGITVIDYDSTRIVATQYSSKKFAERLFYFNYKGNMSELPRAEVGNLRGFIYQTYASDDMNIVCWQISEAVMGIIAGRRSAEELATIASKTMK